MSHKDYTRMQVGKGHKFTPLGGDSAYLFSATCVGSGRKRREGGRERGRKEGDGGEKETTPWRLED